MLLPRYSFEFHQIYSVTQIVGSLLVIFNIFCNKYCEMETTLLYCTYLNKSKQNYFHFHFNIISRFWQANWIKQRQSVAGIYSYYIWRFIIKPLILITYNCKKKNRYIHIFYPSTLIAFNVFIFNTVFLKKQHVLNTANK